MARHAAGAVKKGVPAGKRHAGQTGINAGTRGVKGSGTITGKKVKKA